MIRFQPGSAWRAAMSLILSSKCTGRVIRSQRPAARDHPVLSLRGGDAASPNRVRVRNPGPQRRTCLQHGAVGGAM